MQDSAQQPQDSKACFFCDKVFHRRARKGSVGVVYRDTDSEWLAQRYCSPECFRTVIKFMGVALGYLPTKLRDLTSEDIETIRRVSKSYVVESKTCEGCGGVFFRRIGRSKSRTGLQDSLAAWAGRKFCSAACGRACNSGRRLPTAPDSKFCENCGGIYFRGHTTVGAAIKHDVADAPWRRQRFCSPACKAAKA